jgi:intein-encoded DNA endonuclease-like protein
MVRQMARTAAYELADLRLDGKLAKMLADWREDGVSYSEMSYRLRDHGIQVSHETIRRWLKTAAA